MDELTEMDLLRELSAVRALRITEFESGLREALDALIRAEKRIRDVLAAAGASVDEQLVGSAALAELRAVLRRTLEHKPSDSLGGPSRSTASGVEHQEWKSAQADAASAAPIPDNVRPLRRVAFVIKRSEARPVRDLLDVGATFDSEKK